MFSVNLERTGKVRSLKRKQIVSEGLSQQMKPKAGDSKYPTISLQPLMHKVAHTHGNWKRKKNFIVFSRNTCCRKKGKVNKNWGKKHIFLVSLELLFSASLFHLNWINEIIKNPQHLNEGCKIVTQQNRLKRKERGVKQSSERIKINFHF